MEESDKSLDDYLKEINAYDAVLIADEERFEEEFAKLIGEPHDALGRVLKCHLLAEY